MCFVANATSSQLRSVANATSSQFRKGIVWLQSISSMYMRTMQIKHVAKNTFSYVPARNQLNHRQVDYLSYLELLL